MAKCWLFRWLLDDLLQMYAVVVVNIAKHQQSLLFQAWTGRQIWVILRNERPDALESSNRGVLGLQRHCRVLTSPFFLCVSPAVIEMFNFKPPFSLLVSAIGYSRLFTECE